MHGEILREGGHISRLHQDDVLGLIYQLPIGVLQ
jgi:hypothetical protein